MSIFEPIPRGSRWDDDTRELDAIPSDDEPGHTRGSLDPRSIRIAGLAVAGIVVTGLLVSNAARPDPQQTRPAIAARVDPGAAEVEQSEARRSVPAEDDSASPSAEDESDDDSSTWQEPEDSSDDSSWSDGSKRDDKPGKGHGHGRG